MRFVRCIVLFVCTFCRFQAQSVPGVQSLPMEWFSVKQGLSQGMVSSILQDSDGFMWFATNDGLNKYDGYTVSYYRYDVADRYSLPDNHLAGIVEDVYGNFWVATRFKGLFLFDKKLERFYPVELDGLPPFSGISNIEYKDSTLMIQSNTNILMYHTTCKELLKHKNQVNRYVSCQFNLRKEEPLLDLKTAQVLLLRTVCFSKRSLLLIKSDSLFRYTKNRSASRWNISRYALKELGIHPRTGYELFAVFDTENDDLITFFNAGCFNQFDLEARKKKVSMNVGLDKDASFNILQLNNGNLFLQNHNQFFYFELRTKQLTEWRLNHLKSRIQCLFMDANQILWFGTSGYGAIKCDSRKNNFQTTYVKNNADHFYSNAASKVDLFTKNIPAPFDQPAFRTFVQDSNGIYWIVCFIKNTLYARLARFNPKNQDFRILPNFDDSIYSLIIYHDKKDRLWLFADYGGNVQKLHQLNKKDGSNIRSFDLPVKSLSNPQSFIRDFMDTPDGQLYLATENGLFLFNPDAKDSRHIWNIPAQHLSYPASLRSNSLWCICPDPLAPTKFIWLGTTDNGFIRYDIKTGGCTHYTEKDGLPNNVVYGILPDIFNNLWLSTNKGLSCFNPATKKFQNYTSEDGLQGDEFNHYDYMPLRTGELYFGGVDGYSIFNPAVVLQKQKEAPMAFTELRIAGKVVDFKLDSGILDRPISYAKRITLNPHQTIFTVSFATLEFRSNLKKFYRYQLKGFQKEWTAPSTKNEATFTNLSPGTYTLAVSGTNTDGVWNTRGIELEIVVLPAWYQTWWFILGVGFIVCGLLYTFYRYRLKQQTQLLVMRNHIASDLHDEIGSSLSSISIFSESARRMIPDHPKAEQVLRKITDTAGELMETMSDIVWTINSKNDTADNLINRIRIYAVELSESTPFILHMGSNNNIPDFKLNMNQRKQVYLIFKEAMNNIVKYAACENVWIEFTLRQGRFCMVIRDDGNGFDPAQLKTNNNLGGNGIVNMQKRAVDIHGHVSIASAPRKGTSITLSFNI